MRWKSPRAQSWASPTRRYGYYVLPFLLGDAPTVADFYLVMLMRWSRNMPRPATEWPQLAALAARLKARPSFTMLYAREGLTEWA